MTNLRLPPDRDPDFTPPFCPNHDCPFHLHQGGPWPWQRTGIYTRRSDQARFPRFRCRHCRRGFSTRTFSADYWLRMRSFLPKVADLASNGAALRQIARHYGVSHATVARHLARAGRHTLLFHRLRTQNLQIREPVAFDGFESFEASQFFPFHLNLAAGRDSWFLYDFTDSPLRRKGRMTHSQKRQRARLEARLGRPDPKAVETGVAALVRALGRKVPPGGTLYLESDEHPAYTRALQRVRKADPSSARLVHRTTPSRAARTRENPLFAVNLTDLLLRHSHANHHRETIAFSKRRMGAISRALVFVVWRNWIKRRRENGDRETVAMVVGLAEAPLSWSEVFVGRLFPGRTDLEEWRARYYRSEVWTQALGNRQRRHELKRAF